MNKYLLLTVLCGIFLNITQITAQVVTGGIPIMTTILGKGGDGQNSTFYSNSNCNIIVERTFYAANLEQFEINENTPLNYGEVFYLPEDYPDMDFEYTIGSISGIQHINYFIYIGQELSVNGIVHLYKHDFQVTIDVSDVCEGASSLEATGLDYDFSLVDPNASDKFGNPLPYPICNYVGENDIFPCSVFGFSFCTTQFRGESEGCNNANLTTATSSFKVYCHEDCTGESREQRFHNTSNIGNSATRKFVDIKSHVKVYPNPFKSFLSIEVSNNLSAETTIKIFDPTGNLIYELLRNSDVSDEMYSVNFDHIPSGLYFLKLSSKDFSEVLKIVKQ